MCAVDIIKNLRKKEKAFKRLKDGDGTLRFWIILRYNNEDFAASFQLYRL